MIIWKYGHDEDDDVDDQGQTYTLTSLFVLVEGLWCKYGEIWLPAGAPIFPLEFKFNVQTWRYGDDHYDEGSCF